MLTESLPQIAGIIVRVGYMGMGEGASVVFMSVYDPPRLNIRCLSVCRYQQAPKAAPTLKRLELRIRYPCCLGQAELYLKFNWCVPGLEEPGLCYTDGVLPNYTRGSPRSYPRDHTN